MKRDSDKRSMVPLPRVRRLAAGVLVAAIMGVVPPSATLAVDFGKEAETVARGVAENLSGAGRTTVAVVDFTDLSGNVTELGRFLAEEISVALTGARPGVQVIDRTHLKALLQEHKLSASGLIDPATARKLGKIAGVQALVTGTLTPIGDNVHVALKVLDTNTARILHASTFELARTRTIEDLLGRELGGKASGIQSAGAPSGADPTTGTSRPKPPARAPATGQRVASFLVSVERCEREGQKIICSGTITNTRSEGAPIAFRESGSYAVDNLGNQGAQDRWFNIGSGGSEMTLEPQIPIKFAFSFTGLSREATSATVVLAVAGYSLGRGFAAWNDERLTFRNIPLEEAR